MCWGSETFLSWFLNVLIAYVAVFSFAGEHANERWLLGDWEPFFFVSFSPEAIFRFSRSFGKETTATKVGALKLTVGDFIVIWIDENDKENGNVAPDDCGKSIPAETGKHEQQASEALNGKPVKWSC